MSTTFILVRHATHSLVDRVLVGRRPGVCLGETGRRQALRLSGRLGLEAFATVQSSPQRRALETALPIASRAKLSLEISPNLDEVDFGEWTGFAFDELSDDPRWREWNVSRASARAPGGESMLDVQTRVVRHLDRIRSLRPHETIVIVSHAECIRAALLYHLGLSLDAYGNIELSPGGISTVVIGDWGSKVLAVNERAA